MVFQVWDLASHSVLNTYFQNFLSKVKLIFPWSRIHLMSLSLLTTIIICMMNTHMHPGDEYYLLVGISLGANLFNTSKISSKASAPMPLPIKSKNSKKMEKFDPDTGSKLNGNNSQFDPETGEEF